MTQQAKKAEKIVRLGAQLRSGHPLSLKALAHHLNVDEDKARQIVKKSKLEREGSTYPWRQIWRAIHGTEGGQLAKHLAELKEGHPDSVILDGITDLEAELRSPLIDFATMSHRRGKQPDTLAKALRQGREKLPYPMLDFGPRSRLFRRLEVRLWEQEGIRLNLPQLLIPATPNPEATGDVEAQVPQGQPDITPAEAKKKAIFGGFEEDNRRSAG